MGETVLQVGIWSPVKIETPQDVKNASVKPHFADDQGV